MKKFVALIASHDTLNGGSGFIVCLLIEQAEEFRGCSHSFRAIVGQASDSKRELEAPRLLNRTTSIIQEPDRKCLA